MTLVIPLKAKDGVALQDFYDYWLNAHVTLPPRFPGISSVWLHKTSHADSLWPAVDGVSMRPDEDDTFDGVPEATFPTMDDLQAFIKASRVQMEDGINFLSQEIGYAGARAEQRDRARRDRPGARRHRRPRPAPGVPAQAPGGVGRPTSASWVDDALVPGARRVGRGAEAAPPPLRGARHHPRPPRRHDDQADGAAVPGDGRGGRRRRGGVRAVRRVRRAYAAAAAELGQVRGRARRRACSAASPPSTTGGSRSPGCAASPSPTSSASSARPARPTTTSPASSCRPPTWCVRPGAPRPTRVPGGSRPRRASGRGRRP